MKYFKRTIQCILLVLACVSPVFGAVSTVTATYTVDSKVYFIAGSFPLSGSLIAHIATLVLVSPTGSIDQPGLLHYSGGSSFVVIGPAYGDASYQAGARLVAVRRDTNTVMNIDQGVTQPLTNSTTNIPSPLIFDFYIATWESSSVFSEGSKYNIEGNFGTFTLGVADSGGIIWNATGTNSEANYIPINGETIVNDTPVPVNIAGSLGSGGSTIESVPYGQPITNPQFVIDLQNEYVFDISDALGNKKCKLGTLVLYETDGPEDVDYSVDVSFSDLENDRVGDFTLNEVGGTASGSLHYTLYLGNDLVEEGERIQWVSSITKGESKDKKLYVSGLQQSEVNAASAGTYKDTLVITIYAAERL